MKWAPLKTGRTYDDPPVEKGGTPAPRPPHRLARKKGLLSTRCAGVVVAFPRGRGTRALVNQALVVLVVSGRGVPVETSNNAARFKIGGVGRVGSSSGVGSPIVVGKFEPT